jgi:hypothetical protein
VLEEPPFLIDGARVLAYAALGSAPMPAVAAGITLDARGVAVTENLSDGSIFLLFCGEDWQTLAAESHGDAEGARRAGKAQFPQMQWRAYRSLTAEEAAEIDTTREFLRELARGFPGES